MMILQSSMLSVSALGSSLRLDVSSAMDIVESKRKQLVNIALPYLINKNEDNKKNKYDDGFDKLDAIRAKYAMEAGKSDSVGGDAPK